VKLVVTLGAGAATAAAPCGCLLERQPDGDVRLFFCSAHDAVKVHAEDPKWRELAMRAVRGLAARFDEFTTDEVWEELGPEVRVGDPRGISAVMQEAAKEGLISRTKRDRPSTRPECHHRPVRIWRSEVRR
jgi:hypothetical protein